MYIPELDDFKQDWFENIPESISQREHDQARRELGWPLKRK